MTLETLLAMAPAEKYAGLGMDTAAEGNPVVEQEDLTVSGRPLSGYSVVNASTATKTDTPLMETPVSIQVVPRTAMDDQQAIRLDDATRNVSGVQTMRQLGVLFDNLILPGFSSSDLNVYRDGLRLGEQSFETANLERVEVLKGPAATLFGRSAPDSSITQNALALLAKSMPQ